MDSVGIFAIASRQADHLAVRQSVVASNIANANVASYKASDVVSFSDMLANAAGTIRATNANHFGSSSLDQKPGMVVSDNAVALEQELVKSSEVRASMELNTGIVSAFHRMLMMTARP